MKKKILKIELILLMTLFLFPIFFVNNTTSDIDPIFYDDDYKIDLKLSDYWNITDNILIDDTNPSYNWTITNATYAWCNGAGTWDDPFVIENLILQFPFDF